MKTIFALVRILAGVLIIIFLVLPLNKEVKSLKNRKTELSATEDSARQYAQLGQDVVDRYKSIDPAQIARLKKMLPDTVDNVRFINDLQSVAESKGLKLKKVDYDPEEFKKSTSTEQQNQTIGGPDYGSYTFRFVVSGTYNQFQDFATALENSLRIINISSVTFSSSASSKQNDVYDFTITARSYWLKN